ncbi:hypothetical protein M501DRAFT_1007768 [Patellaria atrata CBS 101060]|uniref:Casein kinase substrate phosphoprotein PP28 domain-containing protein n=1 Tax=Patellaria atrata CBS 101060 TaxID=1346257 RepID=A0A9P4VNQ9_9PEZI|nr:hypothetical protein M501DRAFT_1007768 [Patellaria atrata CBS 101060]
MTSSSSARGRGGKFSKPKRGGGKHFSRDLQPLNADGEVLGMWADPADKVAEESSEEEEEDDEDESSDDGEKPEMTREERKKLAKARKEAAIAKQKQKVAAPGDLPTSSEEEDEDENDAPANPNHTAAARNQASKAPVVAEASGDKKKDVSQLSRREREALQAQQAKERYQKLHAEGKTEEARADLERLRLVRERREAEAARKKAEAEERAEQEKSKAEQMAREQRMREAAAGGPKKTRGKKKA